MPFNIPARLKALRKSQARDLLDELKKRGLTPLSTAELSSALNGSYTAEKGQRIVSMSNEIVTEWEKESGLASDKSINS